MFKLFVLVWTSVIVGTTSEQCYMTKNLPLMYQEYVEVMGVPQLATDAIPLTGCIRINDQFFFPKRLVRLAINCFNLPVSLPKLQPFFINNMAFVVEASIQSCNIEALEPGAFFNLPSIEKIGVFKNPLKYIPKGVFNTLPSLQEIWLQENEISRIDSMAFADLPKLSGINLGINKLEYIRKDWFTNTNNLETANFFKNSIRKIPFGTFLEWKKIQFLFLNSNKISIIEGPLLKDLVTSVTILDLHHNHLTSLSPDNFPDSVLIELLHISGNLLNDLSEEFLKKVRATRIVIFANPFTCPCWHKINKILLEKGVSVDNRLVPRFEWCQNSDVPVCGHSFNSANCTGSVDKQLTRRIISYMKKIHYNTVVTPAGEECAIFDDDI